MANWIHYMRYPDVENYLKNNSTVLLPIGSTEQHGPHLPLMTDAAQAVRVAEAVSEETGVLIAPPLWYGWTPFHLKFPGGLTLRPETLASVMEDIFNSLIYTGFTRIIVITGHTTMNYIPVNPVMLKVRSKTGAYIALVDVGLIAKKELYSLLESKYDGHAGEWETAFMLYNYPETVDMKEAIDNIPDIDFDKIFPELLPADPRITGNTYQLYPTPEEFESMTKESLGVVGAPSLASPEKGKALFEAMVKNTKKIVAQAKMAKVKIKTKFLPT